MIASDLTSETPLDCAESSATLSTDRPASTTEEQSRPALLPQPLGRLFDEAFDLYKNHFATLALVVAILFIPTQIALHAVENLWLTPLSNQIRADSGSPDFGLIFGTVMLSLFNGSPSSGVPGLFSLLISFLISGPVSLTVADILLGRGTSVRTAYRKSGPMMWRLFWGWTLITILFACLAVFCLFVLLILMVLLVMVLQSMHLTQAGGEEVAVLFFILMLVCPYLIGCLLATYFFTFLPPLIAVEGLPLTRALVRNSQLIGKKRFWRAWAAVTFLPIVTFGLQFLTMWGISSLVALFKLPPWLSVLSTATTACVISCFFQPYWMIFLTLFYFDARMRREGLDIRILADHWSETEANSAS